MLAAISIAGMGPHRATALALDPKGRNDLEAPSAAGKTTLADAVPWCLFGVLADGSRLEDCQISDSAEEVCVIVRLGSGAEFERRRKRGGKGGLRIKRGANGEEVRAANDAEWNGLLGSLGKLSPDLLRVTMCPLAWIPLAQSEGGGRDLRNLLAEILPGGDLRAVVAEDAELVAAGGLTERDSCAEKEAYGRRAEKNKHRDELAGELRAATERVQRAQAPAAGGPEAEAVVAARAVLELADAWLAYDAGAVGRAWDSKRAELAATRPEADESLAKHEDAKNRAWTAAQAALTELQRANGERHQRADTAPVEAAEARAQLARLTANAAERLVSVTGGDGTCHSCGQAVDADHARKHHEAAQAELAAAEQALVRARGELDAAQRKLDADRAEKIRKLKSASDTASTVSSNLNGVFASELAKSAPGVWDSGIRLLGKRPGAPAAEAAPEPAAARPTQAEILEAKRTIDAAGRAEGAEERARAEREAADAALERTTARHAAASTEATRLHALVEAIRRAPSLIAARQVGALGDMGPVSIRFPAEGPAVEVLVDGRPWWTASRGRLVIADLHFRAAVRRVLGGGKYGWLPLFVDNAQDFSGEIPTIPGPMVVLRTAAVDGLQVVRPVVGAKREAA